MAATHTRAATGLTGGAVAASPEVEDRTAPPGPVVGSIVSRTGARLERDRGIPSLPLVQRNPDVDPAAVGRIVLGVHVTREDLHRRRSLLGQDHRELHSVSRLVPDGLVDGHSKLEPRATRD